MAVGVLIVDDQEPFRLAARAVVEATDGFEVVGEVDSGEASVDSARHLTPDLVLMDVNLPGIDGLEATRRILAQSDGRVVVLLLSTYEAEEYAPRAAEVGGRLLHPPAESLQEEVEATVLFSDIRGYSTLAEQLEAREVTEILTRHLAGMSEVIQAHGGTVAEFVGDAVMAVFGAPDPLPDHAERALRCALAMQTRQGELNAEAEGVAPLHMGIGVNTGTVMAGTMGGGGRLQYTVIGDAVNVAARLQGEAEAGEILATAATVGAAPGVTSTPAGSRMVKGRKEPVQVHRIQG